MSKLDELEDVGDGLIACPWSITNRPKIQDDEWGDSSLMGFKINELIATQDYLRRDTVKYHLEVLSKITVGENMNPNVVLHDGKYKIYDGHHRLMALMLIGATEANCWTLERT